MFWLIGAKDSEWNQILPTIAGLGVAGLVLRDSVLGVRLPFKPRWYRSHLLCVARNAHILGGYVERVTRRKLWIGQNWRGLLGEDGLSEKQQKG